MGIIYCLESPSGKKYIGQTIRSLEKRFKEHCKRTECIILFNAIQKYKPEHFKKEILLECNDDLLNEYEQYYIEHHKTLFPNGYNIRSGGSNGFHCDNSKQKMRESKLGIKNHNFGKPRSEITKERISIVNSGENHHFYNKRLSIEHKLNLSKSLKSYDLPMYVIKVKARPEHYCSSGYAIINHPVLKNKYFTSKKISDEVKLSMVLNYLNSYQEEGSTTKW